MFKNAKKFNIESLVSYSIQGDYYQVNNVGKDEKREIFELYSRLAQNFDEEPYYSSRHDQNLRRLTEGTCRWLLEDLAFIQWRDDPGTQQPILWVHGSPGSGKSTLCSQAIRSLADSPKKPTVAYHFCDFARPHKEIEILSMLACQLLDADPAEFADLPPLPISILSVAALQLKRPDNVRNIVKHLVHRSPSEMVYFLLDGVDEELGAPQGRWNDGICPVIQFLVQLAVEFPQHVRVWVSSQRRGEIKDQLLNFQTIDIVPFARNDIVLYLSKKVPEIRGPTESDRKVFLQALQDGAESSFIWARLMMEELCKRPTLGSMREFIEAGFPRNLNDYYQKIFDRCPQHLRPLASMVFSLLVYAKRPLRFCELWEAVWCLSSKTHDVLDPDDKPWESHLHDVFQPFIELVPIHSTEDEPSKSDELQYTCRIIHSTLKDFLVEHRTILCTDDFQFEHVHICPELAVKACLNYLQQSRFSDLLHKEGEQWLDISGTPVMNNRFLIYAAKYWDKHLDNVVDPERHEELIPKVSAFVKSPNFWTVLQVQAIWVQAQFSSFHTFQDEGMKWLRRMFPFWFMMSDEGFQVWMQNRSFLRQWRYFLCCGICSGVSLTQKSPYTGEMDHIWTGALGPNHFLTERRSRVSSFALTTEQTVIRGRCVFFTDLTSDSGSEVYTLQISYANLPANADTKPLSLATVLRSVTLDCMSQTWEIADKALIMRNEQVFQVQASSCDFDLYVHNPSNPYAQTDRAPLAAFSSSGQILRIGSKLFQRDSRENFTPVPSIHSSNIVGATRTTRYFEEASRRDHFIAVTSRTRLSKKELDRNFDDLHDDSDDELDVQDCDSDEDPMDRWNIESQDSDDSDLEFASDDDSLSEGSSVFSNQDRFDDDGITPWADYHLGYSDGSDSEGDGGGGDGFRWALGGGGIPVELDSSDSEEEEDTKDPPAFNRHFFREEDDEDWEGLPQYFRDQKTSRLKPRATIAVFDTTAGSSTCVFRKQLPLRCKIYASPPVFHPSKPLVVWPLGDGDILFVDYVKATSFTRRLRPSTPFTRHVSIQCTFSTCGQFMHLAALEARRPDPKTIAKAEKHKAPLPPIHLALLVSTYRLSSKKTTRSPPTLIHRIRIDLKEVKSLNTRQMPFSLTWTKDFLYVTASWKLLQVWRVPLFSDAEASDANAKQGDEKGTSCDDSQPVMAPEKTVFMPKTCTHRSVRFYPAVNDEAPTSARIVVGHEVSIVEDQPKGPQSLVMLFTTNDQIDTQKPKEEQPSTSSLFFEVPVVCYLEEEENLGKWVDSMSRTKITENLGIGVLDARIEGMEKFNPEDDCELEPYYY